MKKVATTINISDNLEIVVTGFYTPETPDDDSTGPGLPAQFEITELLGDTLEIVVCASNFYTDNPGGSFIDFIAEAAIKNLKKRKQ